MAKFRNEQGKVLETNDPATILNYQNRAGFSEVKSRKPSSSEGTEASKPASDKK